MVGEVVAEVSGWGWLMGSGEHAASGVEGDFGGGAGGGQDCREVARAGVGFAAGELDAWSE